MFTGLPYPCCENGIKLFVIRGSDGDVTRIDRGDLVDKYRNLIDNILILRTVSLVLHRVYRLDLK